MESERLWAVILAAVSFLAGIAGGILMGQRVRAEPTDRGPFAAYQDLFLATFDLDATDRGDLQWILDRYHRDLEELKGRHLSELEPELIRIGETCRDLIVEHVLDEEERMRFQSLSDGTHSPFRVTASAELDR